MEIPDFRKKEDRDRYREDNACCTPSVAREQLLPNTSHSVPFIPDEIFEDVRKQWLGEECKISDLF